MNLGQFIRCVGEALTLPGRWRRGLGQVSVFAVLDQIEARAVVEPMLNVDPRWLVALAVWRARLSWRWARNRCLLRGMLLYYLLPRAGCVVDIHFGARLRESGRKVAGHCWLSTPDVSLPRVVRDHPESCEVHSRCFYIPQRISACQTSFLPPRAIVPVPIALPATRSTSPASPGLVRSPGRGTSASKPLTS